MNIELMTLGLKSALASLTTVPNWDYWGSAPDPEFPRVGAIWPMELKLEGSFTSSKYFCSAALYADSPEELVQEISAFVQGLVGSFAPTVRCPPELAALGMNPSIGAVEVGAPNTASYSSVAPEVGGVWCSVSFELYLEG